mmetsp:Transcript_13542/g.31173  ORF Transcript_13542/g.31173 Transcript_13542/m.31173 type:complete len:231 (-) Transcript_13542:1019-1711(-)
MPRASPTVTVISPAQRVQRTRLQGFFRALLFHGNRPLRLARNSPGCPSQYSHTIVQPARVLTFLLAPPLTTRKLPFSPTSKRSERMAPHGTHASSPSMETVFPRRPRLCPLSGHRARVPLAVSTAPSAPQPLETLHLWPSALPLASVWRVAPAASREAPPHRRPRRVRRGVLHLARSRGRRPRGPQQEERWRPLTGTRQKCPGLLLMPSTPNSSRGLKTRSRLCSERLVA